MDERQQRITKELHNFIEDNYFRTVGVDEDADFGDDDLFLDNGIVDSTGMLEVIAWIEKIYLIKINDEELRPEFLGSVNRTVETIIRKLGPV